MAHKLDRHGKQALKRVIGCAKAAGYELTNSSMNGKNVVYATFFSQAADNTINISFDCCNNRGIQTFERALQKRQDITVPQQPKTRRPVTKNNSHHTPA